MLLRAEEVVILALFLMVVAFSAGVIVLDALRVGKGRMIGGKRFVRAGTDRNKSVKWRVEVVQG